MQTATEVLALLELAAVWILVCVRYRALPALIHSPFNGAGDAHGLGTKDQLWLLLILTTIFYLFVTGIARLPLPINVPAGTSEAKIARIRGQVPLFLALLKIAIFALVFWKIMIATQLPPPAHRRLVGLLLSMALVAVAFGFPVKVLAILRRKE